MREGRIVAEFSRDQASQEQIAAAMMSATDDALADSMATAAAG
jgi:hypothetical protein